MKGNVKETLLFWLAILSGLFSIASFFCRFEFRFMRKTYK